MKKFIFDVDGTLTPSRCQINSEFLLFMMFFATRNDVYLVTGSDRDKTLEQVGVDLCNASQGVYNCSGSDAYEQDENVYRDEWTLPWDVERFLYDELDYSQFIMRNGNHIERRPGGVNFSILGRAKDPFLGRKEYMEWDKETNERADIADRLRSNYPGLSVALGGQTGIDIGPWGSDKSQILRDFSENDELYFFGDRMEPGGNDHSLGEAVKNMGGYTYHVKNWEETRTILEGIHD